MMDNQIEKLRGQLQDFDTAVLITRGENAAVHARPMAVARVDENCDLWFFTGAQSAKVDEIEAHPQAQVICQSGWSSCVIVAGRAMLNRDRATIRDLWKPAFKLWFPDGAEDPNLVLIHFTGQRAEYWDNTGANRLTYLYQAFKAGLRGTTPEIREGVQHGEVTLAPGPGHKDAPGNAHGFQDQPPFRPSSTL
jgi:general stress protein 26